MLLALVLALLRVSAPAQAVDGGVFVPAVCVVSVFPLVAFVVVPVTRGVVALGAGVRLLARVSQHVPLQVHALVAGVAAHAAVERLGARVDALVPPKVGEVSAGVAAGRALIRLLARVHTQVALEVVEVRGGVGAVRAAVGFLLGVGVGVAGQVVGVVGQEGAVRAAVQLLATLASPGSTRRGRAAGRPGSVFGQQVQRAATTHLKFQTEDVSDCSPVTLKQGDISFLRAMTQIKIRSSGTRTCPPSPSTSPSAFSPSRSASSRVRPHSRQHRGKRRTGSGADGDPRPPNVWR